MRFTFTLFVFWFLLTNISAQQDTVSVEDVERYIYTLSLDDLEGQQSNEDFGGLLSASRDIYISTAGFTFGQTRFRIRGYDNKYNTIAINGVPMNDMESGRAYWSTWGGLNNVTRDQSIQLGIVPSDQFFGSIGGLTDINMRASSYRKELTLNYSMANRTYNNRLMFKYSSGKLKGDWYVTLAGSRRWAQEAYVEGTFYDAWGYFLSVEKKFNKRHAIGMVAFGAPNKRGRNFSAIQEAYDLAGSNYYNPTWGYQNGEKRNSRVGNYHQPVIMLTHYWDFDPKTSINTSVSYQFGRGGSTALDWYDGQDPRPDYYKYLPSGNLDDPDRQALLTRLWQTDENFRQVKWDDMIQFNAKNLYLFQNIDGIEGNDLKALRANYIVEDRRNDKKVLQLHSVIDKQHSEHLDWSAGVNLIFHEGDRFKVVDDLLGGDYFLDINRFAEQDFVDPIKAQSDLNNPNNLVQEGDIFGYHYKANVRNYRAFGLAEFTYPKVDFFFGLDISYTSFWRTGMMRNGFFPENSYGDSEKNNFFNYGLKGGLTYKITGRHMIQAHVFYGTVAPTFWNAYLSARTRNTTVNNLTSETIYSGDISYIIRSPKFNARATFYYTQFMDLIWTRSFYHDDFNSFVNYSMTGIDQQHMGLELGLEGKITSDLSLTLAANIGEFIHNSRPEVTVTSDNENQILAEDETVYLKNYYVGGPPQSAGSIGIRYFNPNYWWIGANVNYFWDIYLELNPARRTSQGLEGYVITDEGWRDVVSQEELSSDYTVDLWAGKSWKINDYYISVSVSVNNLLNNTDFAMGGFEQLRYDREDVNKFPPKYNYLFGTTYFINLTFSRR